MNQWYGMTRLHDDPKAIAAYEDESRGTGKYLISTPGLNWHESSADYARALGQPVHQRKQYRNGNLIDTDSRMRMSPHTNGRYIHQLEARTTLPYKAAGRPSLTNKDLESELIMGVKTRSDSRAYTLSGVTIDRFHYLPEHGNPQRVQHVIPQWIRGGDNTRDHVRRVNYQSVLKNKEASKAANL